MNTSHPLIQNVAKLGQGAIVQPDGGTSPSDQLASMICEQVYDLALMAPKGFDAGAEVLLDKLGPDVGLQVRKTQTAIPHPDSALRELMTSKAT